MEAFHISLHEKISVIYYLTDHLFGKVLVMCKKSLHTLALLTGIYLTVLISVNAWAGNADYSQAAMNSEDAASAEMEKYGMLPIYGRDVSDGVYPIEVKTISSLFRNAEAELIVENGEMQAVFALKEEEYLYLYMGTEKEAAAADESKYIAYTESKDGKYAYEIPIEALDKRLNCAAFSKEEKKWYDCTFLLDASALPENALLVELPDYDMIEAALDAWENSGRQETTESSEDSDGSEISQNPEPVEPVSINMKDGEYAIEADIEGGSGKASISSPMILTVRDGKAYATLIWSSSNYDYMIVGTEKYLNESEEGVNSSFEIPIACMDEGMPVIADTTAMGTPHEVSYTLTFYSDSIGPKSRMPQEAAKRVVIIAIIIIVGGGILNHFVNRKK